MLSYAALSLVALVSAPGANAGMAHKYNGPGPRRRDADVANLNFTTVAEKSVPFTLWDGKDQDDVPPVWHWTTSIQQAPYPEAAETNGTVMNTMYSFSWNTSTEDQTLRHELLRTGDRFDPTQLCVTVIENTWSPANIRNYDFRAEDDARAANTCMGPFHKKCLEYVVKAYKERPPAANGCRGGNINLGLRTLHEFPQCEVNWPHNFYHATTYDLMDKSTADMALPDSFPLKSGWGFAYAGTDVYDLHNQTHFQMANDRVHAIIIQSGDYVLPLCMRVKDKDIYDFKGNPEQIVSLKPEPDPISSWASQFHVPEPTSTSTP